jgi:hypothetical protein
MKNIILVLLMIIPTLMIGQRRILSSSKSTAIYYIDKKENPYIEKGTDRWVVQDVRYRDDVWEIRYDKIVWVSNGGLYYDIVSYKKEGDEHKYICLGKDGKDFLFMVRGDEQLIVMFKQERIVGIIFELDKY